MTITFPHFGNTYIAAKALLDDINAKYIIPSFNNKKTLDTGLRYCPEGACLPLKLNIGNFIEAYEKGADTILVTGGKGPCRFGYYCRMYNEILEKIGIKMKVLVLEIPDGGIGCFFKNIKELTGTLNPVKLALLLKNTVETAIIVDSLERACFRLRPLEFVSGKVDLVYNNYKKKILFTKGSGNIKNLTYSTMDELEKIELKKDKDKNPLKIGVVGEIFTAVDQFSSHYIQEKLGRLGCEVSRELSLSNWITEHILKPGFRIKPRVDFDSISKPYMETTIGGHATETIGNAILYARKKYDGIIHIYPLTCAPEIAARCVLPDVSIQYGIPILTLLMDELSVGTGYMTRIEAFVDVLEENRNRKNKLKPERVNG